MVRRHHPDCDRHHHDVNDRQQEEARSPVEQLGRDTREDGPKYEAQRIAGAETGKHPILALGRARVEVGQHPLRRRNRGSRHQTHHTVQHVQLQGLLGKSGTQSEDSVEDETAEKEGLAAKQVCQAAEAEEKGATGEPRVCSSLDTRICEET